MIRWLDVWNLFKLEFYDFVFSICSLHSTLKVASYANRNWGIVPLASASHKATGLALSKQKATMNPQHSQTFQNSFKVCKERWRALYIVFPLIKPFSIWKSDPKAQTCDSMLENSAAFCWKRSPATSEFHSHQNAIIAWGPVRWNQLRPQKRHAIENKSSDFSYCKNILDSSLECQADLPISTLERLTPLRTIRSLRLKDSVRLQVEFRRLGWLRWFFRHDKGTYSLNNLIHETSWSIMKLFDCASRKLLRTRHQLPDAHGKTCWFVTGCVLSASVAFAPGHQFTSPVELQFFTNAKKMKNDENAKSNKCI